MGRGVGCGLLLLGFAQAYRSLRLGCSPPSPLPDIGLSPRTFCPPLSPSGFPKTVRASAVGLKLFLLALPKSGSPPGPQRFPQEG